MVVECDQLFHELVHRFFVKWRLWFAKRSIRNMRELGQRGTRLESELSSGFILTWSLPGVLPGIRIHSFRPTKTRKSVIEASLPHHLSPLFLNICPEPVRNERTSASRNYLFSAIVPLVRGKILWTRHDGNREKRRTNTDSGIKRLKWTISFYDDDVHGIPIFFFFLSFSSAKRYISRVKKRVVQTHEFEELLEF